MYLVATLAAVAVPIATWAASGRLDLCLVFGLLSGAVLVRVLVHVPTTSRLEVTEVSERFSIRDGVLRLETADRIHTVDLVDAQVSAHRKGVVVRANGLPLVLEWDHPEESEVEALMNALESAGRRAAATRGSAQDVPRALAKLTE